MMQFHFFNTVNLSVWRLHFVNTSHNITWTTSLWHQQILSVLSQPVESVASFHLRSEAGRWLLPNIIKPLFTLCSCSQNTQTTCTDAFSDLVPGAPYIFTAKEAGWLVVQKIISDQTWGSSRSNSISSGVKCSVQVKNVDCSISEQLLGSVWRFIHTMFESSGFGWHSVTWLPTLTT